MAERITFTPVEARIALVNEVFSSSYYYRDQFARRGHYSEAIARALHGSGWRSWYHPDNHPLNPEQFIQDAQKSQLLVERTDQVLDSLTEREQLWVRRRFGLLDGEIKTLYKVGSEVDHQYSGERARQVIAKALRKLRHPSRSKFLTEFLPENSL